MVPVEGDAAEVDRRILDALAAGSGEAWGDLWAAVDELAGVTNIVEWRGGEVVGTTVVDGEERPVRQVPYPVYAEPVERMWRAIGALGLFVPFAWPDWDGVRRYRDDPAALAGAPVSDAVRLLVAVRRSERFSDGSIAGAWESGVLPAALARLRRWHDTGH